MGACSFACVFVWLFADSCPSLILWLVGWLVVCVYVCLYVSSATCSAFSWLLHTFGGLGTPLQNLGLHFAALGERLCVFLILGGTLGLNLLIPGLRLRTLGVHFDAF